MLRGLNYDTRLWECVQIDNAEVEIPGRVIEFSLYHESASGLLVPKVLFERGTDEHQNATAEQVTDAFAETWLSHYPKPGRVRTDPEGAFQSQVFRDFLAANDIMYEVTAGDAHHQLGLLERKIQTIKRLIVKLAHEFPHLSGTMLLAVACSANNELERRKNYSPNQWAFGAAKPAWEDIITTGAPVYDDVTKVRIRAQEEWLRQRADDKLVLAQQARARNTRVYRPGETVMVWRSGKGTKSKPGWGGR